MCAASLGSWRASGGSWQASGGAEGAAGVLVVVKSSMNSRSPLDRPRVCRESWALPSSGVCARLRLRDHRICAGEMDWAGVAAADTLCHLFVYAQTQAGRVRVQLSSKRLPELRECAGV